MKPNTNWLNGGISALITEELYILLLNKFPSSACKLQQGESDRIQHAFLKTGVVMFFWHHLKTLTDSSNADRKHRS